MAEVTFLADLLLDTKDGDWGLGDAADAHAAHYVIRGADFPPVRLGNVESVPLRYLPDRTVWRRVLQPNDILFETAGGTKGRPTGRSLIVTDELLNRFDAPVIGASFTRFLRPDPAKVDPHYLYWYLQYRYLLGDMYEYQVQHTGVARFQYTVFAVSKELHLAPRNTQGAIAAVLSAIDDKTAANAQILRTLDALAVALTTQAIKTNSGLSMRVGDLVTLNYGKALPASARVPGGVAVYGSGGQTGWHDAALVNNSGIVVGRKGTVGAVYWANGPHFPIDTTYFVTPRCSAPLSLLYYVLRSANFASLNSDSAVPGLNREEAYAQPVRFPPEERIGSLAEYTDAILDAASAIKDENKVLARTRDELLPLLMSGRIRVKDAEARVSEVV